MADSREIFDSPEVPQGMERCFPFFLDTGFPPDCEQWGCPPSTYLDIESLFQHSAPQENEIDKDLMLKKDFLELTHRICLMQIVEHSRIALSRDADGWSQDVQV